MRLIYAEEAIKSLMDFTSGKKTIGQCIDDTPTASIEQKTGHWIDKDEKSAVCSCCNRNNTLYGDFCKWCGAKMVKQQKSEE